MIQRDTNAPSQAEKSGEGMSEEHKLDAHDLRNYLSRFISDNQYSYDVEHRWLADYAQDLMAHAYSVKAGDHDKIKKHVIDFRLTEIEKERGKTVDATLALDNERDKLLREIEQAS